MLGGNPTATSPAATNYLYTGEQFDEHAQHYYLRARYYNPLNGRFNRMEPYAGSPQDPQSLHKYLYCHANPVSYRDPSGKFALMTLTYSTKTKTKMEADYAQVTTAIYLNVWESLLLIIGLSYMLYNAANDINNLAVSLEIKEFVQEKKTQTMTQEEFDKLEQSVARKLRRRRDTRRLYLRYGFMTDIQHYGDAGLKAPSWVTRTVYPTGWHAKWYLALFVRGPRDAMYIVLPHGNTTIFGPNNVRGRWDTYVPDLYLPGRGLMGQGQEWYIPNGTGPGTVFGPIPIPEGKLEDVR